MPASKATDRAELLAAIDRLLRTPVSSDARERLEAVRSLLISQGASAGESTEGPHSDLQQMQ